MKLTGNTRNTRSLSLYVKVYILCTVFIHSYCCDINEKVYGYGLEMVKLDKNSFLEYSRLRVRRLYKKNTNKIVRSCVCCGIIICVALFYRTNIDLEFTVDESSDQVHVLVNISDHDAHSHPHRSTSSSADNDLDDSSDKVHVLVDISDNDENPHALAITNSSAENDLDDSSDQNRVLVDISDNDENSHALAITNSSADNLTLDVGKKFLIFENKGRGQGIGNIMNGLISCLLLAQKYDRIVCVSSWDSFNDALQSVHKDECAEILKTTSNYHRESVQCWNFGVECEKSCWQSAGRCDIVLGSAAQVVWFDGNEYPEPIFPALRDGFFSALYTPTSALQQMLVWATVIPPKTVVHLREGDDASDVREGLDATTLNALYQHLPSDTFIITNSLRIHQHYTNTTWDTYEHDTRQRHTALSNDISTSMLAWRDWYTIFLAESVYHTQSAFSESALRCSGSKSKRITGRFDPGGNMVMEDETWHLNTVV